MSGGFRARPDPWPFYEQLASGQRDVVDVLLRSTAWRPLWLRLGDRRVLVPPGAVVFSQPRLAAAAGVSRGAVIKALHRLEGWEEGEVLPEGVATWPRPRIAAAAVQDHGRDQGWDQIHDQGHRISPSLLLWRDPARFRIKPLPLIWPRDQDRDQDRDHGGDHRDDEKRSHLRAVHRP